jgi:hypothetical protein
MSLELLEHINLRALMIDAQALDRRLYPFEV